MADSDYLLEDYVPIVKFHGINTAKDTVLGGATTLTGLATLTAGIDGATILAGTETIAGGGTSTALDLGKTLHHLDADAGGDIFTLAAGTTGQLAICTMESATGVATITPVAMAGGTSVTFNAAGETAIFLYQDAQWYVIGGNAYTVI